MQRRTRDTRRLHDLQATQHGNLDCPNAVQQFTWPDGAGVPVLPSTSTHIFVASVVNYVVGVQQSVSASVAFGLFKSLIGLLPGHHLDRSGSVCLNNFPRFISGLRAGCQRCRVVHSGGGRLRRTDRRGGQLGAHQNLHLMLPLSLSVNGRSKTHQAWRLQGLNAAASC